MSAGLVWERDGRDWPHHEWSRFIKSAGLTWHVQVMGRGPVALLVHGTGASTHSWRLLAPILARSFTVVMADLPGHGFTQMPHASGLSLPAMTEGICQLLVTMNEQPAIAVGHSAGAALLARAILDRCMRPKALVAVNGALLPFDRPISQLLVTLNEQPAIAVGHSAGAALLARAILDARMRPKALVAINGALLPFDRPISQLFSPLAKMLALNPLVPRVAAWRAASPAAAERLIRNTGSKLDAAGIELYRRLFRSPKHISGALGMMANWDLSSVVRDLPRLAIPLVLVTGSNDLAIPPDDAATICRLTSKARTEVLCGMGHLVHEEAPAAVADIVLRAARRECENPLGLTQSRLQGTG